MLRQVQARYAVAARCQSKTGFFPLFVGPGGLVTELRGIRFPLTTCAINFSIVGAAGVVAKIIPFNHRFSFRGKIAAPLAAGKFHGRGNHPSRRLVLRCRFAS